MYVAAHFCIKVPFFPGSCEVYTVKPGFSMWLHNMHVYMLQEVNMETGQIAGTMRAENVPLASSPVITFWEGDIIDNTNNSFITSKWNTSRDVDMRHWFRFTAFQDLRRQVLACGGRCDSTACMCASVGHHDSTLLDPCLTASWGSRSHD